MGAPCLQPAVNTGDTGVVEEEGARKKRVGQLTPYKAEGLGTHARFEGRTGVLEKRSHQW